MFNLKADINFNTACKKAYLTRKQFIVVFNNFVANISERLQQSKGFLNGIIAFLQHLLFVLVMQQHHFLMDYRRRQVMGQFYVNVCGEKGSGFSIEIISFLACAPLVKSYFKFREVLCSNGQGCVLSCHQEP